MCVIVVLPKNIEPDWDSLENCFLFNPDGAGYAYTKGNRVIIKKGFFSFEEFHDSFNDVPLDIHRVAHFRIATQGLVDAGNCHPFPITNMFEHMRRPFNVCEYAVFHNGIFSGKEFTKQKNYSDSMHYVKKYLYHLGGGKVFSNRGVVKLISQGIGTNKLAIMAGDGQVKTFGNYIKDVTGIWYSNDTFKDTYAKYAGYLEGDHEPIKIRFEKVYSFEKYLDLKDALEADYSYVIKGEYNDKFNVAKFMTSYYPYGEYYEGLRWELDETASVRVQPPYQP